jgi:uncharacterized protein (DUF2235 family)
MGSAAMKNVVVCCDGTGNEVSENISNVLKLYRVLRKTGKTTPRQVVFYDPGVGTLARPDPWTKFRRARRRAPCHAASRKAAKKKRI